MATLLCLQYPELAIFDKSDGTWTSFVGGRLDIEDDDPHYGVVMGEAARNPAIAVYQSLSTCPHCGEDETSAKALKAHVKELHFDKWIDGEDVASAAARVAEVKARAGVVCDACSPPGTYADDEALALHVKIIHTSRPELGPDGAGDPGDGPKPRGVALPRPGEVDADGQPVPAATGRQRK